MEGPLIVHQSDLSSWVRCPSAFMYSRQGQPGKQLSATAYGSVMHHALECFERLHRGGSGSNSEFTDAVDAAVETFTHYWHPTNIDTICQPVDTWLPRQGYAELRSRGINAIRTWAALTRYDDQVLLATEYSFQVPIDGTWDEDTGEPHILAGTIDRLAVRKEKRRPYLAVDDFKTGVQKKYLRHNVQFTAYCYATTKPEFWSGWRGEDGFGEQGAALYERFKPYARRGTWIDMKKVQPVNAGWRGPEDYRRFALAVEQITASMAADIYPLNLSGETCEYCEFKSICTGTGVPENDHGAPV
jgi:ATP-dependent helicase/DNAse subunit B